MSKANRLPWQSLLLLLFLAWISTACKDDTVAPTTTETTPLQGTVRDMQDYGISYAVLEIYNDGTAVQSVLATDTTDEEGNFSFPAVPRDMSRLRLRVMHPDFQTYIGNVGDAVRHLDSGFVRLSMRGNDSCCGQICITVLDADSSAVQGAQVKMRRGGRTLRVGHTNAMGKALFAPVCEGEYDFRIAKDGYKVVEPVVVLDNCDSVNTSVVLQRKENPDTCCNNRIKIVVRDSTTNAIIPNATVKLWRNGAIVATKTTNGDGAAVFEELCAGSYGISILRDNYTGRELNVTVNCNSNEERLIRLLGKQNNNDTCCNNRIEIVVRDSTTNEALSNTTVKIRKDNTLIATKTTNGDGRIVLEGLCPGTYNFAVLRDGYAGREFSVTVTCRSNEERVIRLFGRQNGNDTCCNNRINIVVRDSTTNLIIPNVTVKLWRNGAIVATKTTNGDGAAVFEELCSGTYGISILRDNYINRELNITVSCNSNEERLIRLLGKQNNNDTCCNNRIEVVVRDSTNNAIIPNATVKIRQNGALIAAQTTNGEGRIVWEELCPGTYNFAVLREGYAGREFSVTVTCNSDKERVIRLLGQQNGNDTCSTAVLKVRAKDSTAGSWLAGATVVVRRGNTVVAQGTTNAEGWYVREALVAPAEYTVTISKEGYESKTIVFRFAECKTYQETFWLVLD